MDENHTDFPAIMALEDVRAAMRQMFHMTGLSQAALVEICNKTGQGPRLTRDTLGRIMGREGGESVRYSAVAHAYTTLQGQINAVSCEDSVEALAVAKFRMFTPSDDVQEVLGYMAEAGFTYGPYEEKIGRRRVWQRAVAREKLADVVAAGGTGQLGDLIDEVEGGILVKAPVEMTVGEFVKTRSKWDLCLVQSRPTKVDGLFSSYDLRRITDLPAIPAAE